MHGCVGPGAPDTLLFSNVWRAGLKTPTHLFLKLSIGHGVKGSMLAVHVAFHLMDFPVNCPTLAVSCLTWSSRTVTRWSLDPSMVASSECFSVSRRFCSMVCCIWAIWTWDRLEAALGCEGAQQSLVNQDRSCLSQGSFSESLSFASASWWWQ